MHAIASGNLTGLQSQFLGIFQQAFFQDRRSLQRGLQILRRHAVTAALNLHHYPCGAGLKADNNRHANNAFAAGKPDFDAFTILQHVQGRSHCGLSHREPSLLLQWILGGEDQISYSASGGSFPKYGSEYVMSSLQETAMGSGGMPGDFLNDTPY